MDTEVQWTGGPDSQSGTALEDEDDGHEANAEEQGNVRHLEKRMREEETDPFSPEMAVNPGQQPVSA